MVKALTASKKRSRHAIRQRKLIEGVFTPEQKQQIVRDLTDAMVAIEGENMRQVPGW